MGLGAFVVFGRGVFLWGDFFAIMVFVILVVLV